MFDIAPTELLLVAIVALLVIGPKDLPLVMRKVGQWAGKARGVARQFRSGFDAMVREAELEEMERKWREENERIMREYPAPPPATDSAGAATGETTPEATEVPQTPQAPEAHEPSESSPSLKEEPRELP